MAKKKANKVIKQVSVSEDEQKAAQEAILLKYSGDVVEKPRPLVDPLKKEANKLQQVLRKNRFHNKYETVKVSPELLVYIKDNKLDTYNQTLIVD